MTFMTQKFTRNGTMGGNAAVSIDASWGNRENQLLSKNSSIRIDNESARRYILKARKVYQSCKKQQPMTCIFDGSKVGNDNDYWSFSFFRGNLDQKENIFCANWGMEEPGLFLGPIVGVPQVYFCFIFSCFRYHFFLAQN